MPEALHVEESTATQTYARFVAEPWENGFGHTLGNALRRVLLSSMEGVAVCSVHIEGVQHEFAHIPDVVEDVTEIILNIKKLRLQCNGDVLDTRGVGDDTFNQHTKLFRRGVTDRIGNIEGGRASLDSLTQHQIEELRLAAASIFR